MNTAYVNYIAEAGFTPVLLPDVDAIEEFIDLCDGLVMPGGIDIDPLFYLWDNESSYNVDPKKDEFEREVFHGFRMAGKPIFGICRGFQLIFLEFMEYFLGMEGEPKYGDFLEFCFHISSHGQTGSLNTPRHVPSHLVDVDAKGLLGGRKGVGPFIPVNSMHHQCVLESFDKVARKKKGGSKQGVVRIGKFRKLAWTDRGLDSSDSKTKNVVEAFSISDWDAPILAVQWHPEELRDYYLLQHFFLGEKALAEKVSANGQKI
jgi:gamma-glutamyl-gamma-aminobutyrate hydrolase PuuD